ncbi:MAG TPA: type II CAAX endopeptidase family protein, partial [Anaerolineales bacterium]|nr:type II CAAX endopeptidase family protein [Anaerolineales bacterium]
MNFITRNTFQRPILTGVILILFAFVFRLIDIFVLRLDERLGEIILSKALGFSLVVLFVWAIGKKLSSIGFHGRRLRESLLIGTGITVLPFIIAYTVEWIVLNQFGQEPRFLFSAIDPKAGVTGGILFALWLVLGNFINSFMEEGLFRGVMLNLSRIRLSFVKSNWLQAALFGVWHLVWVVKWYQTGVVSTPGEIGLGIVANFLPQICLGLVWGYAYGKTDNLWTAWIAHTLTNTTLNLLHVATLDAMDPGMSIRMTTFSIVSLLMMFLIRYLCNRRNMPELTAENLKQARSFPDRKVPV